MTIMDRLVRFFYQFGMAGEWMIDLLWLCRYGECR